MLVVGHGGGTTLDRLTSQVLQQIDCFNQSENVFITNPITALGASSKFSLVRVIHVCALSVARLKWVRLMAGTSELFYFLISFQVLC